MLSGQMVPGQVVAAPGQVAAAVGQLPTSKTSVPTTTTPPTYASLQELLAAQGVTGGGRLMVPGSLQTVVPSVRGRPANSSPRVAAAGQAAASPGGGGQPAVASPGGGQPAAVQAGGQYVRLVAARPPGQGQRQVGGVANGAQSLSKSLETLTSLGPAGTPVTSRGRAASQAGETDQVRLVCQAGEDGQVRLVSPVSYTHLTLPTKA